MDMETLTNDILNILRDPGQSPLVEAVIRRLDSFGYKAAVSDSWLIAFSLQKTRSHILNQINHQEIPDGLREIAVDMICGEILGTKLSTGQLELEALDLEAVVESIEEGDAKVVFSDTDSDTAKAEALIGWLREGKGCDFSCFRRMRW
ncbi:MAG: hypothetical protein J6A26_07230 [Oscillospiraceae bacterium]|nr:hypothetical protein [Oscillospiraceae bacterium]